MTYDNGGTAPGYLTHAPGEFPPERRGMMRWFVGGGLLAAGLAVVLALALTRGGGDPDISYVRDEQLTTALLSGTDFPSGYDVTVLSQPDLDDLDPEVNRPDSVSPAACETLMSRGLDGVDGTYHVGALAAVSSGGTAYSEVIARNEENLGQDWNPDAFNDVLDECGSITAETDGTSLTLSLDPLDVADMGPKTVAFTLTSASPSMHLVTGLAQRGDRLIMLMAVSQSDIDTDEFGELFRAAVDQAAA